MHNNCKSCIWGDKCHTEGVCEYFSPIDEMEDTYVDELIESRRTEYVKEWFIYIESQQI